MRPYISLRYSLLLTISLFFPLAVKSDGTADDDQSKGKSSALDEAETLEKFFNLEGIQVNRNDPDFISRYSKSIVEYMQRVISESTIHQHFDVAVANKMIYDEELKKDQPKEEGKVNYEALMRAIDLIVPDSKVSTFNKSAKQALRKFFKDKPEHAKELLDLVHYDLVEEESYSKRLPTLLRHFYYHWIPLAHLADVIENKGSVGEKRGTGYI